MIDSLDSYSDECQIDFAENVVIIVAVVTRDSD